MENLTKRFADVSVFLYVNPRTFVNISLILSGNEFHRLLTQLSSQHEAAPHQRAEKPIENNIVVIVAVLLFLVLSEGPAQGQSQGHQPAHQGVPVRPQVVVHISRLGVVTQGEATGPQTAEDWEVARWPNGK